jgi:hypothetical protein
VTVSRLDVVGLAALDITTNLPDSPNLVAIGFGESSEFAVILASRCPTTLGRETTCFSLTTKELMKGYPCFGDLKMVT